MPTRKVSASFVPSDSRLYFDTAELQSFQREEYMDTFGIYQSRFGLYNYMQMNQMHQYTVHTPKGSPLVWQPWTSCAYDQTGSLSIGKKTIVPTPIYMNEKFCQDELLDSVWRHHLRWEANGEMSETEQYRKVLGTLIDELQANAALGLRMTMTSGQLHGQLGQLNAGTTFDPNATVDVQSLFKKTHHAARGWVKLMADLALSDARFAHLNIPNLIANSYSTSGEWQGDIMALYESLKDKAPAELKKLINRGAAATGGGAAVRAFRPLFVVSDNIYNSVITAYNAQQALTATNGRRITKQLIDGVIAYFIDDIIPIVPIEEIAGYDQYLKGFTNFAGIIGSGVINLGGSFISLPNNIENKDVAMVIERDNSYSNNTHGMYTFVSHALAAAAISDARYAVATMQYVEL